MSLSTVAGGLTAAVAPRESKRRSQRNLIPNQGMVESSYGCVFVKLGRACTVAHHSSKPSIRFSQSPPQIRPGEFDDLVGTHGWPADERSFALNRWPEDLADADAFLHGLYSAQVRGVSLTRTATTSGQRALHQS